MKARLGAGVILIALTSALIWQLRVTADLRRSNETLAAELHAGRAEALEKASQAAEPAKGPDPAATAEIARLRGEVTQLRSAARETDALKARNLQLQAQNQQLRSASTTPASAPTVAPSAPADSFPRESWTFAGYANPESALVSAIWAMREGNPKTYLDSLSPEEQTRMSQLWGNKPETEVAAKHQSDVSKITSFRIVERQEVSAEQVLMSVYIGGVERLEKVSMQKVGNDWKFGGFVRDTKQ